MRNRLFIIYFLVMTISCSESVETFRYKRNTYISSLRLSSYDKGEKSWDLKCFSAEINEKTRELRCNNPQIFIIKGSKVTAEIYGKEGIIDLQNDKSFIKEKVRIHSKIQNLKLFSEKIYLDSKKNIVWSDSKVKVLTEKTETIAEGFTAKPDLSNVKFYRHETKKI